MKKTLFTVLIILAAVLIFAACQTNDTQVTETAEPPQQEAETQAEPEPTKQPEKVEIIHDTPEVFESHMTGEFLLLDVRTQEEYDAGHIEGATLIPVTELEGRLDEIADYKDKKVLVYCRSGNRSVTASYILIDNGFTNVHNLLTGFNGWSTKN